MSLFRPAVREQLKLRLALSGPPGSGKTFTALRLATALAGDGGRIAVVDTENRSAEKYVDEPSPDGGAFAFDVLNLKSFHPSRYVEAIQAAEAEGYDVLVLDTISHAWAGKDGVLSQVDRFTSTSRSKSSFSEGWRKATPLHDRLVDAMVNCSIHLIVTMRSKQSFVVEQTEGGARPKAVGLAPVQRDGVEYEFDVVGAMDGKVLTITKTRCPQIEGQRFREPGAEFAGKLTDWLEKGSPSVYDRLAQKWSNIMRVETEGLGLSAEGEAQLTRLMLGASVRELDERRAYVLLDRFNKAPKEKIQTKVREAISRLPATNQTDTDPAV